MCVHEYLYTNWAGANSESRERDGGYVGPSVGQVWGALVVCAEERKLLGYD